MTIHCFQEGKGFEIWKICMYLPKPGIELSLKKGSLTSGRKLIYSQVALHRCSHGRRFWRQSPRRTKLALAEVGVRESEEWGQTLKRCLFLKWSKVVVFPWTVSSVWWPNVWHAWDAVKEDDNADEIEASCRGSVTREPRVPVMLGTSWMMLNVISVISYYVSLFLMFFGLVWRHWFGLIKSLWFAIFVRFWFLYAFICCVCFDWSVFLWALLNFPIWNACLRCVRQLAHHADFIIDMSLKWNQCACPQRPVVITVERYESKSSMKPNWIIYQPYVCVYCAVAKRENDQAIPNPRAATFKKTLCQQWPSGIISIHCHVPRCSFRLCTWIIHRICWTSSRFWVALNSSCASSNRSSKKPQKASNSSR